MSFQGHRNEYPIQWTRTPYRKVILLCHYFLCDAFTNLHYSIWICWIRSDFELFDWVSLDHSRHSYCFFIRIIWSVPYRTVLYSKAMRWLIFLLSHHWFGIQLSCFKRIIASFLPSFLSLFLSYFSITFFSSTPSFPLPILLCHYNSSHSFICHKS